MQAGPKSLAFLILILGADSGRATWAADQEKLSLFNVIDLASKNHPEIAVLQARVAEARARKSQAPSIPPPMLSGSVTGAGGPFSSDGRMENSIEVSQIIPFPTKLTAESRARGAEERVAEDELQAREKSVRADARAAFFDLYRVRGQLELLKERRGVLLEHVKRVRATPLADRLAQAHLLRVQTDATLSQNELDRLVPEEVAARGKLNIVIGRDPGAAVAALEAPPLTELPADSAQAPALHPAIRSWQSALEASEARSDRAHSAWLPDFRVQYRSNRRFDGVMANNSELTLGIELPFLFFWQPRGQVAEAEARLEGSRASLAKSLSEFKLERLKARSEAESLRGQLLRYEREILPQSQKRMQIAHGIAPSDMESLDEHRGALESWIALRRAALDLRVSYEKAVAVWESLENAEELRK